MPAYYCVLCGRFWPERKHECSRKAEEADD